jgi:hypothetical protein
MKYENMKNKNLLAFAILSSIFVVGLLLPISSISGKAFAAVNCRTDNGVTSCSGSKGGGPVQPGINGGAGEHTTCTDIGCSVSGSGGGGGTGGNPVFHPDAPGGGGSGIHQTPDGTVGGGGGGGR